MVVKDRLAELKEAQAKHEQNYGSYTTNLSYEKSDPTDPNGSFGVNINDNQYQENEEFIKEINSLKFEIDSLSNRISELKKKYNSIINPSMHSDESDLREQATQYKLDTDYLVSRINNYLKAMKRTTDERIYAEENTDTVSGKPIYTAEIKARRNHYNILALKFKENLMEYENIQQNYKDRIKAKLKREMKIIDEFCHFDDQEMDEMIESGNLNIFDQGFLKAQENKEILTKLEKRAKDMESLEKSMLELRNIFVQLQTMVEEQGYVINSIMDNVEATEVKAEHAVEELRQAATYQSSARRKKIFVAVCCIILIIILIIVLCVTLIPKTN